MKKILLMCLSLLLFASALVSCEEWTEPESKVFLKGDGHDDAYYAALRKWKEETDYDMAWGWFGGLGRQLDQPQELAPGPSRQPLSGGHLGPVASQHYY